MEPCVSIKDSGNAKYSLDRLLHQTYSAFHLFRRGNSQEAGQHLISGTAVIKELILAEIPMTILSILHLVKDLCRYGQPDTAMAIMRQITALGSIILCPHHPIPQVFSWLAKLESAQLSDLYVRASCSLGDQFEYKLGVTHSSTLTLRCQYWITLKNRELGSTGLQKLLPSRVRLSELQDIRYLENRKNVARQLYRMNQDVEAERECDAILDYMSRSDEPAARVKKRAEVRAHVLQTLVGIQDSRHNLSAEEGYRREAIAVRMACFGERDAEARDWMLDLEELLQKTGQQKSATQIQQRRRAILAAELRELREVENL